MVEALWNRYHDEVYRYIQSRLDDRERARDLTQDVFETIVANQDQFDEITSFDRWIYRIAKNQLIDHTRKKRDVRLEQQDLVPAPSDSDKVASLVESISTCLKSILEDYTPEHSELFLTVFRGQMTQKDAARKLGIPYSTLKSRVQKARRIVSERFVEECCTLVRNREGHVINCDPVTPSPSHCDAPDR